MKRILVTTDFSTNSTSAIRFAMQVSKQTGAELIFYHVIEIMKPTSWSRDKYAKFEVATIAENSEKLEKFVSSAGKNLSSSVRKIKYVVEIGTDVTGFVIKAARKNKADFICISSKGAGNVKRLFGTNSSALIMHSPIPLAIIPPNYKGEKITKLFYASDLDGLKREMKVVQELASDLNAATSVYHYDYMLQEGSSTKRLEKIAAPYSSKKVKFIFKRQEIDISLSEHLSRDIKKEDPSALILFTKQNRNWFDRLFNPSETASFSFNAHVPMLVFRKKK